MIFSRKICKSGATHLQGQEEKRLGHKERERCGGWHHGRTQAVSVQGRACEHIGMVAQEAKHIDLGQKYRGLVQVQFYISTPVL